MTSPSRPRLADHVVARLHRRGDVEQLVLLDTRRDRVVVLDARAWSVLCTADGTRDVAGVVAAARRLGARVDVAAVAALLGQLAALGWLADGAPEALLEGEAHAVAPDDTRAIREFAPARYRCDGRGGCCGGYPTLSLTPADVHRLAAVAGGDAVHRAHRVFLPSIGSAPTVMRALALVDGACAYLESDGACGIHRRGGVAAKPIGCSWFPTRLIDDGVELRAAPAVECACVGRPDPEGPSLLPAGIVRGCDLPVGVTLVRLPQTVAVAPGQAMARTDALAWIDGLDAEHDDPAALLWSWSSALAHGTRPRAIGPDAAEIAPHFARVADRAAIRLGVESTWRGDDDRVCRRLALLGLAARLLAAASVTSAVLATPATPLERHVLRVGVFARQWLHGAPIAQALREQALQMWLARAIEGLVDADADVSVRETPLAAVHATWRAQGLGMRAPDAAGEPTTECRADDTGDTVDVG